MLQVASFISRLVVACLTDFRSLVEYIQVTRLRVNLNLLFDTKLAVASFWFIRLGCMHYLPSTLDAEFKMYPT